MISVNVDAQKHYATEFLAQFPADFDVIYDPKGNIIRQYQVRGMPSSFIVDRTGKIVASHTGFNEHKKVKYEKEIIALLKGKHE